MTTTAKRPTKKFPTKKMDIYAEVTNRIIQKLEEGVVSWQKPFMSSGAVNWKTQKAYRGINAMLLDGGEYATFLQIKEAGGTIKKGEKGHIVVFWKILEKEDEDGNEVKIPYLKYHTVFEINKQCEGLQSKRKVKTLTQVEKNALAEEVLRNYPNKPKYNKFGSVACYKPLYDEIEMPMQKEFISNDSYYATFFHEAVHSTGSALRLKREGIVNYDTFGSERYSKEELVAEIGASFLCSEVGINTEKLFDNSVAYIQSWLRALKNDKTLIVQAARQAQKAVDYILNRQFEKKEKETK